MQESKKITLFRFKTKSKEEKAIIEINKKRRQIEKLKEEILKMGRLVLKDGKLQKDESQQQPEDQPKVMPAPPIDIEYTKPKYQAQEPERMQEPVPQEFYREPPIFRGNPQQPQYEPQQDLTVDIILVEGQTVQVKVSVNNAQTLLDAIGQSIESGTVLVVGNKAINPKHIVMYQYV